MEETEVREGVCAYCGGPLGNGRSDRSFCCVKCRVSYNNAIKVARKKAKSRVLGALEQNYRILRTSLQLGVSSVSIESLRKMGFSPDVVTSCRKLRRGSECRCYDIMYRQSESKVFQLQEEKYEYGIHSAKAKK